MEIICNLKPKEDFDEALVKDPKKRQAFIDAMKVSVSMRLQLRDRDTVTINIVE